jgi:ATP-dependent DNA ligase
MASTATPARRRVERATLPTWVKPQLAALVKEAPEASDWLHEIKLDGYRMHARKDPGIAKAIAGLPAKNACLDGELCGVLPDGRTAFNLIQNASNTGQGSLVLLLVDLLFIDGEDITGLPLPRGDPIRGSGKRSRAGSFVDLSQSVQTSTQMFGSRRAGLIVAEMRIGR